MKPVVQPQPQPVPQQGPPVTDEQAITLMNKWKTQGSGAIITLDELIANFGQIFTVMMNQKNQEISALRETLAKVEING